MGWMFNKCNKLKEIKGINKINTNKVTNMRAMFQECNKLEFLDLSNFNTTNVADMGWMFFNSCNLKYLNISNFTYKVNCSIKNIFIKINHDKCKLITNNEIFIKLYH